MSLGRDESSSSKSVEREESISTAEILSRQETDGDWGDKTGRGIDNKNYRKIDERDDFLEFVQVNLAPKLKPGDVVVMDNLNSHHREGVKEAIEAVGAKVEYLPVYSPEFNPIEMMWSQLKSFVRKFRTETMESLSKTIEVGVSLIHSEFLKNWFTKCCYCAC
jgi:putative transposase